MQVRLLPVQVCVVLVQTMHVCANMCLFGFSFLAEYEHFFANTHKYLEIHASVCKNVCKNVFFFQVILQPLVHASENICR